MKVGLSNALLSMNLGSLAPPHMLLMVSLA
jgi:hypothetical protein